MNVKVGGGVPLNLNHGFFGASVEIKQSLESGESIKKANRGTAHFDIDSSQSKPLVPTLVQNVRI